MSYQQFSNPPATNTSTSTTVVHVGQPAVIHAPQQPLYNPFAAKAGATKKLGIAQLVIGIVVFIMGILMISIAPNLVESYVGGGIWSGIFIIVAGSLCLAAGSYPERYGTRCAALTFCIISLVFLSACGLMNFLAFAFATTRAILSLILSILMLVLFVITLISAINTGRGCCNQGCCNQGYPSGHIVTQPEMAPSGVVAVSNHQATTIPMTNQSYAGAPTGHQPPFSDYQPSASGYQPPASGYQPPTSDYQPPLSGYQLPASGYQPPTSAYQPPTSANQPPLSGYQPEAHPFPGQQQQCNQAATGQSNVTYGVDYSQQKAGIPEGGIGDAPPPYNPKP